MNVLCVAEKNEAAKGIAAILSQNQFNRREGRSKYNKIYEFPCIFADRSHVTVVMTSVSGHLLSHNFNAQFTKWDAHQSDKLFFEAQVISECPPQSVAIKETLEREVRMCNILVLWTDCDREGENIAYEIINVCQGARRRLRLPELTIKRAKFSEITGASIQRAWANLGVPDPRMNAAVECRSELDLRIGAAFTRLMTLLLRQRFPRQIGQNGQECKLVSYGSCQFPTLGFVVQRYNAVQAFVPETFWKIKVMHTLEYCTTEFHWLRGKLFIQQAVQLLLDECQNSPTAQVTNVRGKPKEKWRPVGLETIELEKLGNRKLRMTAKNVMAIAEKLYTRGFVSYPRTETNKFPPNFDLVGLVTQQTQDPRWGQFAQQIVGNGPNPRNGHKSDQAHPPITPTKYARPGELNGDEEKLYELIVRHFLACVSRNANGHETIVDINIATESFTATGLQVIDPGYLQVYPYDKWEAKHIGNYAVGHVFNCDSIEMIEGETQPPKLLTEADLIALMDKHQIGTDATHAEHIEKIKDRMYVGLRPDARFVPGFLGLALVEGYESLGHHMCRPNLRAQLENDLKLICQGVRTKAQVLDEQLVKYHRIFVETRDHFQQIIAAVNNYWGTVPPA